MGIPCCRGPATAPEPRAARRLANRIWAREFAPAVECCRKLIVCLDYELYSVPLEILRGLSGFDVRFATSSSEVPRVDDEPPHSAEGFFGIGGLDLQEAPEARAVVAESARSRHLEVERQRRSGPDVATVNEASWTPLEHTAEEVERAATKYETTFGRSPRVLTGREASRRAFFAGLSGARSLHLATHGYIRAPDIEPRRDRAVHEFAPMTLCGLWLSGAHRSNDDFPGVVTAEEIAALDLCGRELAVLSACSTYGGQLRAGHGLASIQGAFHAAGVRTVLSTRWKIDDALTAELVHEVYIRLWNRNMTPHAALESAKSRLRERHEDLSPEFWAAFLVTGDLGLGTRMVPRAGRSWLPAAIVKPPPGDVHGPRARRVAAGGRSERSSEVPRGQGATGGQPLDPAV